MEPVRIGKDGFPIDHARLDGGKTRTGPVVDDFAGTLGRAGFEEVDADPLAAAHDVIGAHAIAAQCGQAGIAQVVLGQAGDELDRFAVVGQRDGHIGFAAAVDGFERTGLGEALKARRRQAEHDFAKGDDFFHGSNLSIRKSRGNL